MRNLFSFSEKVVVVTGGAGYLGRALVEGFLAHDAKVILADLAPALTGLADWAKDRPNLHLLPADLSDSSAICAMLSQGAAIWDGLDVLVNCAFYGAASPLEEMTDEEWQLGLDGAVGTAFRCTREVLPFFQKKGSGAIVNFASMYGLVSPDPRIYGASGQNNPANYGAGKAAVIQLTRYSAAHLAKYNIRVNCVTPGPFPDPAKNPPADFLAELSRKTMLGRVGEAEEIVGAVLYLASAAASFTTGSNLVVDGGWTAW